MDKACGDDGCAGSCGECADDGNLCTSDLCEDGQCFHPALSGEPCEPANAAGICEAGECLLGACNDGFGNCDTVDDNGCEAEVAVDPENCSLCGLVCTTANPAKLGTCLGGECSFTPCGAGTWNMDGLPGNGCECSEAAEVCNGIDDNCDGDIDEGFDLASDLANCGECGLACVPPDALDWACTGGTCVVTACPDGFVDKNGDWADGCEEPLFYVGELWVDSINGGNADEDGSSEKPFDSIDEAVLAASPSTLIRIRTGTYAGGIEVNKAGLSLVAEEDAEATVGVASGGTGFHITASEVTIAGLKIAGGRYGIHFDGPEPDRLLVGAVFDVEFATVEALDGEGQGSAAVLVEYADNVTVSAVTVESVEGGVGKDVGGGAGGPGGSGVGIGFRYADHSVAVANDLSLVLGGDGSATVNKKSTTGPGGVGAGILLDHADYAWLAGNLLNDIWGGDGGPGGDYMTSCATGGLSAGIYFETSTGALVEGNTIAGLDGGQGGSCPLGSAGRNQQAYGLYLDSDSTANAVAVSNTLEGDPIIYLHGVDGVVVEGLTFLQEVNPTNWGKIAVVNSDNVQLNNNELAWFRGVSGSAGGNGTAGARGVGVRLQQCTGCTASGNRVTDIVGGMGGNGGYHGVGAVGGPGFGFYVVDSTACTVRENFVRTITGGQVGANGYAYSNYGPPNPGGDGFGYLLDGVQTIVFSNNVAAVIKGGWSYACKPATRCVKVDASDSVKIKLLTCYDTGNAGTCLPGYGAAGYGVEVGALQEFTVQVLDSIISTTDNHCLYSAASGPGILSVYFSDLHSCGEGLADNATLGSGYIEVDPEFEDAEGGDFHLGESSQCIDAGNQTTPCADEPPPNGCRVNMGAYGNTHDATSAPEAEHCDACPE